MDRTFINSDDFKNKLKMFLEKFMQENLNSDKLVPDFLSILNMYGNSLELLASENCLLDKLIIETNPLHFEDNITKFNLNNKENISDNLTIKKSNSLIDVALKNLNQNYDDKNMKFKNFTITIKGKFGFQDNTANDINEDNNNTTEITIDNNIGKNKNDYDKETKNIILQNDKIELPTEIDNLPVLKEINLENGANIFKFLPDIVSTPNLKLSTLKTENNLRNGKSNEPFVLSLDIDDEDLEIENNVDDSVYIIPPNMEQVLDKTLTNNIKDNLNSSVYDISQEEDLEETIKPNKQNDLIVKNQIDINKENMIKPQNNIEPVLEKNKVLENINVNVILNENININSKRPAPEDPSLRKKIKLDNSHSDDISQDEAAYNFTKLIFDSQKTLDENNPNWQDINDINTAEEYFNFVTKLWQSDNSPNPHENLTKRVIPNPPKKVKNKNRNKNKHTISISSYYNEKINFYQYKLSELQRWGWGNSNTFNEYHNNIAKLINDSNDQYVVNKFYSNSNLKSNAQLLNAQQFDDLVRQDDLIERMKRSY